MHGGWYPNRLVRLADRELFDWTEPAVHEELKPKKANEPQIGTLQNPLEHYTFEDIRDQVLTNVRYSYQGFLDIKARGKKPSAAKMLIKPIGKFIETYLLKRGFLDGMPGLIISINAAHSMFLKYAYFFDKELNQP